MTSCDIGDRTFQRPLPMVDNGAVIRVTIGGNYIKLPSG